MSILRPSFPGYLPAMLAAVRSNIFAPTSLQMAWTSIFLPVPLGPARRMDLVRGACSWTAWDPAGRKITGNLWCLTIDTVYTAGICTYMQSKEIKKKKEEIFNLHDVYT